MNHISLSAAIKNPTSSYSRDRNVFQVMEHKIIGSAFIIKVQYTTKDECPFQLFLASRFYNMAFIYCNPSN